jgi:hypothetical protein
MVANAVIKELESRTKTSIEKVADETDQKEIIKQTLEKSKTTIAKIEDEHESEVNGTEGQDRESYTDTQDRDNYTV